MEDFKAYLSGHSKSLREGYVWMVRLFLEWLDEFNVQPHEIQLSHLQGYINQLQEEEWKEYKIRLTIAALRKLWIHVDIKRQSQRETRNGTVYQRHL